MVILYREISWAIVNSIDVIVSEEIVWCHIIDMMRISESFNSYTYLGIPRVEYGYASSSKKKMKSSLVQNKEVIIASKICLLRKII